MTAESLMIQGTASSVGKSLLVTALCRILRQDGLRVAPFKAQNMSNNSYVTADGGEIGRAQVNQAEAAGIEPTTDMNPILLKPESDRRSQIVLNGRPYRTVAAGEYFQLKPTLWPAVTAALDRLREQYDAVVIEGAGSPAEINLKHRDIVNMRVARYAGCPVLLLGDIDRGGVFAHLLGTLELLSADERRTVRALAINKFRGDPALLQPGLRMIEARTGVPVAGVLPYLHDLGLPEEDAATLQDSPRPPAALLDVAVVQLPHISNFDDFDPLARESDVSLRYVASPRQLGRPDLVILPGTKSTVADLRWLRDRGIAEAVAVQARRGGAIIGICGGFQMLGSSIADPLAVESRHEQTEGLGLLDARTVFKPVKFTRRVRGRVVAGHGLLAGASSETIEGYEIHMGETNTENEDSSQAAPFQIDAPTEASDAHSDGRLSSDGWILGTYLHGLFANDGLRATILRNLATRRGAARVAVSGSSGRDAAYDRLAAGVREALDLNFIRTLMAESQER